MKHYGDITKLSGHELPVVDVISGGSPCQDLSVAGKRAGLAGERSGLFMEQIRIIKEMRESGRATGRTGADVRPRFCIWENVPGAFSSGKPKGADFAAVIEEFIKVGEPGADVHVCIPDGGWPKAGCYYAEDGSWSLAWRVHDAQFWGVPQRRKRISLLADFGGSDAPWILFDPQCERASESGEPLSLVADPGEEPRSEVQPLGESLRRNPDEGGEARQRAAGGTESGAGVASYTLKVRGGVERDSSGRKAGKGALIQTELSGTLGVSQDQTLIQPCLNPWDVQSKHIQSPDGVAEALYSVECRSGGGESYVMAVDATPINTMVGTRSTPEMRTTFGVGDPGDPQFTLSAAHEHAVFVDVYNQSVDGDIAASLTASAGGTNTSGPKVMSAGFSFGQSARARSIGYEEEVSPTLRGGEGGNQKPCALVDSYQEVTGPILASGYSKLGTQEAMSDMFIVPKVYENHSQDTRFTGPLDVAPTVMSAYGTGGNNQPIVLESNQNHATITQNGVCNSLPASMGMGGGYTPMVVDALPFDASQITSPINGNQPKWGSNCHTLSGEAGRASVALCYGISAYDSNAMKSPNPHSGIYEAHTSRTLDLNGGSPACNQGGIAIVEPIPIEGNGTRESHRGDGYGKPGDKMFTLNTTEQHKVAAPVECLGVGFFQTTEDQSPTILARDYKDPHIINRCSVVRRLTPKECERLQAFPDGWTDIGEWVDSNGKKHKDADSPRYKALGNSIALPFWDWMAVRICAMYDRPITLGSLFDGIGGFPLVFERHGAKAVWASEIEEFAIAVTKKHFPETE